jgi:hypothetical protein
MSQEPPKQPRRSAEEESTIINSLKKKVLENYEAKGIDLEEIKRMKDYDFLRFIRARKYELEPAFNMLMAALEWRTKEKPHRTCTNEFYISQDAGFLPRLVFFSSRPSY